MGKLAVFAYKKLYKKEAPEYVKDYSVGHMIFKPIRKWLTNEVAAGCPFNSIRIGIYRLCGFKIGKHTHIGMKCYLDDHCHKLMEIGDNVVVSYGVYFACHGAGQEHTPIIIEDGAYIGMRASIISNNRDKSEKGVRIGKNAIVGACAMVNCNVPEGAKAVGVPCRIVNGNEGE